MTNVPDASRTMDATLTQGEAERERTGINPFKLAEPEGDPLPEITRAFVLFDEIDGHTEFAEIETETQTIIGGTSIEMIEIARAYIREAA